MNCTKKNKIKKIIEKNITNFTEFFYMAIAEKIPFFHQLIKIPKLQKKVAYSIAYF